MNKEVITAEEVEVLDGNGEVVESDLIIRLRKSYAFEDITYDKIDLRGLEDLTANDMIAASRVLERSGSTSFLPEMSVEYSCALASRATKLPIEFFKGLGPKDAMKLKNRVTGFLYGAE